MNTLPSISREVRLLARPDGLPGPEHFEVASVPMPVPAEDEVLGAIATSMYSPRRSTLKHLPRTSQGSIR
jgi:NADPH-dependent curcumin reductase CurA